ncbi:hypothetical protein Tco_0854371 [Tanacetum coccineum]
MESLYRFRSIHGANCTVGLDIEMTRQEEEKWWSCGGGGVAVRRLWFRRGGVAVDPPVALTLRTMSFLIFKGAKPIGRLRPDAFEAKAEWWVSSRAFFDGCICEPPQIPPAVRNYIYQLVDEQDRSIKELQQQNGLNAFCMPGPLKAPVEVPEDFGLSDLSGFQNTEASSSFFEGAQMTPTNLDTPHIGTPMTQPGFASCFSRYLPHIPTLHILGTYATTWICIMFSVSSQTSGCILGPLALNEILS